MLWTSRYDWDAATTMGFLKNYGLSGNDRILARLYTFAATYRYLYVWCNVLLLGVGPTSIQMLTLSSIQKSEEVHDRPKEWAHVDVAHIVCECLQMNTSWTWSATMLLCPDTGMSWLHTHTMGYIYGVLLFISFSWLFSYSTNFSAAVTTSWRLHV